MMNNILGQFGLGGRLADNIRERQGMAYYAFSSFDPTVGEGPLVVRAGVDPNKRRARDRGDRCRGPAARRARARRQLEVEETRSLPDRIDPATARNEPQHRRFPAELRAVRPGAGLRPAPAGASRVSHDRRDPAAAAEVLSSRSRGGRRLPGPSLPPESDSDRARRPTRGVFFDVDFTLIYPGPRFQASGYHDFCARHGIDVDPAAFDRAVAAAASGLDPGDDVYDAQLYIDYTRRIIEGMGGAGPGGRGGGTRHLRRVGRLPALLACTTMCRRCFARCTRRG